MDNEKEREEFEECIYELRNMYEEDPKTVMKETQSTVRRINMEIEKENKSIFSGVDFEKFTLCILILLIALTGFINVKDYLIYLFGFAFFCAGFFIGTHVKGFGLIFLFSHGVSALLPKITAFLH